MNSSKCLQMQKILRSKNIELSAWDSVPDTIKLMNTLMISILIFVFGSSYSSEKFFSSADFVQSTNRNRLENDTVASYLKLIIYDYKPCFKSIAAKKFTLNFFKRKIKNSQLSLFITQHWRTILTPNTWFISACQVLNCR